MQMTPESHDDFSIPFLENIGTRSVLIFLFLVGIIPSLLSLVINLVTEGEPTIWLEGWLQNFSTEMFGGLLTFILFDLIIGRREKRTEQQAQMRQQQVAYVTQLKSASSPEARQSILDEMNASGTLTYVDLSGMVLQSLNFNGMNLSGANLSRVQARQCSFVGANLQNTNLAQSIFVQVNLSGANLKKANLMQITLTESRLSNCDLSDANVWGANARQTDLTNADLRGATLWGADLRGANLDGVKTYSDTLNGVLLE